MKWGIIFILILLNSSAFCALSLKEFKLVEAALYKAYGELAPNSTERLSINTIYEGMDPETWWDTPMVRASYVYTDFNDEIVHNIYLMGGYVRQSFMTQDGLALTGCHEIGHGIGGEPIQNNPHGHNASTEGQSDYYSTSVCIEKVFKHLKPTKKVPLRPYHLELCSNQTNHSVELCLRVLVGLEDDVAYFNSILRPGEKPVSYDAYSTHIQLEINRVPGEYPDPQCRLDTQINGILGLERPECWYPGGEPNGTLR